MEEHVVYLEGKNTVIKTSITPTFVNLMQLQSKFHQNFLEKNLKILVLWKFI